MHLININWLLMIRRSIYTPLIYSSIIGLHDLTLLTITPTVYSYSMYKVSVEEIHLPVVIHKALWCGTTLGGGIVRIGRRITSIYRLVRWPNPDVLKVR